MNVSRTTDSAKCQKRFNVAMKTGKRTLVVYYSLRGKTDRVARDLAMRLGADLERIGERKNRGGWLGFVVATLDSLREHPVALDPRVKDPKDYALTIVGTPIWAGKITPAVRAYLRVNRDQNDVAFFTTSASTPAAKVVPELERLAARQAIAFEGFAASDLLDQAIYQEKIGAFLERLQRDRSCEVCGQEPRQAFA